MGRMFRHTQSVFSRGELTNRMLGRTDNDVYNKSYKYSENMIPLPQGPLTSRSGTVHVLQVKNSAHETYLAEFRFSNDQAYMLEMGDQYIRVFKDRVPVKETATNITGATTADPVVITSSSHGYSNGDWVYISGVVGMTELNDRWYIVANSTTNTYELTDLNGDNIDGSGFTAYTSGGIAEKIYEITTPWAHTDLAQLSYTQSGDVLFMFHSDYQPRSVGRIADTNWTVSTVAFNDGPYLPINATDITLTPAATTGSGVTVTASSALFTANDVGRQLRVRSTTSSDWGYAEIVTYNSATSVDVDIVNDFATTAATAIWRLSYYGGSYYGWPSLGVLHEERFTVAGSKYFPTVESFSQTGLYSPTSIEFGPSEIDGTVIDSNGFNVDLSSGEINDIAWLSSGRTLLTGTAGAVHSTSGAGTSSLQPLTPESKVSPRQSSYGSKFYVRPHLIGNSVVYVTRSGEKLREIYYDFSIDGYRSRDVSLFNNTILSSGIVRTCFQKDPDPTEWLVKSDGTLVGFTFEKDNEVEGFHRHVIGGTNASVKDCAAIPRPDGVSEDLWLVVERTDGAGNTIKSVEYVSPLFEEVSDVTLGVFSDSSITVTNSPASATVSGLWHLEGQTVSILADGSPQPPQEVSNGSLTLNGPYEKIIVGLPYTRKVELHPPEVPQLGSIMGEITSIKKVHLRLEDSVGLKHGIKATEMLDAFPFNGANNNFNTAAPLFNGVLTIYPPSGFNKDSVLILQNNDPLPLTIQHIVRELEINN